MTSNISFALGFFELDKLLDFKFNCNKFGKLIVIECPKKFVIYVIRVVYCNLHCNFHSVTSLNSRNFI